MTDYVYLKNLIKERAKYDPNDDYLTEKYWNTMVEFLGKNEQNAIEFISECNEDEVPWVAEIFDDLSLKFQSRHFIDYIKSLQSKFPNLDIDVDIKSAEDMII